MTGRYAYQYRKAVGGYVADERQYLIGPMSTNPSALSRVILWHHGAGGETHYVEPAVEPSLPQTQRFIRGLVDAGYWVYAADFGTPSDHRHSNDHNMTRMTEANTWLTNQGFTMTKRGLWGLSMGHASVFNWAHRNISKVAAGVGMLGICDYQWVYDNLSGGQFFPNAVSGVTNLTGAVTDVDENPDTPDALWMTNSGTNLSQAALFDFPNPSGSLTGNHTFRAWVRKGATGANGPTCQLELYENGVFVKNIGTARQITNTTGEMMTGTFTLADLTDQTMATVQLRVAFTPYASGGGTNKSTGEIGAIDWKTAPISDNIEAAYNGTGTNLPTGGWATNAAARDPMQIDAALTVATVPWRLYYSTGDTWVGDHLATPNAERLKTRLGANASTVVSGTANHSEAALQDATTQNLVDFFNAATWT